MHPMLMTHIAQEDVAERLRSIERERLARMAKASQRSHTAAGRSGSLAGLGEILRRYVAAFRTPHQPATHRATTAAPCVDVNGT